MFRTLFLCLLVLLVAFQVEGRKRYKYRSGNCKVKVVKKNNGDLIRWHACGTCDPDFIAWVKDIHNLRRRLTAVEEQGQKPLLFRGLADEIFMAVKESNGEGNQEIELDFDIFADAEDRPTLLVRQNGEEIIVVVLDDVNLNIDRANMIQSEKDAELLEQIETGLAQALLENESQL